MTGKYITGQQVKLYMKYRIDKSLTHVMSRRIQLVTEVFIPQYFDHKPYDHYQKKWYKKLIMISD